MTKILHKPGNKHIIKTARMIVSTDENGEGLVSLPFGKTMMPLISADGQAWDTIKKVFHEALPFIRERHPNFQYKVIELTQRTDITEQVKAEFDGQG